MQSTAIDRPFGIPGATLWALIGVVLYAVGLFASMLGLALIEQLLLGPLGVAPQAGTSAWGVRLAARDVLWGGFAAAASAPIGRRLVPDIRFERLGMGVLGLGILLAAATTFVLHEWGTQRYGTYFDAEYVGLAIFAAPALLASALATWAAMSVPRASRLPLVLLAAAAALALGFALAPSLPGLADGIESQSAALAAILLGDIVFVGLGVVISLR